MFIYLLVLFSLVVRAEPYQWPDISTDEAKVKYLLHVEKLIPDLFEGMTAHDTDLLLALTTQQEFLEELEKNPGFQKFVKEAPNRKQLQVAVRKDEPAPKVEIDPVALQSFKDDLKESAKMLSAGENARENVKALLTEQLNIQPGAALQKNLLQLVPFVKKENLKDFYKLPPEKKIAYFSQNPPLEDPAKAHELTDIINGLNELRKRDEGLRRTALLVALTEGHEPMTTDALATRLNQLVPEEEAHLFGTTDETIKKMRSLLGTFPEKQFNQSVPLMKDAIGAHGKVIRAALPQKAATPLLELSIQEVPPPLAMFLGCVGGDCSTKNTAAYVHSANSRTFFVDSGRGTPGGYIEAPIVESGGKKYLNLSSINGTKLSADHTEAIVRAFHEAKDQFGVSGIILPTAEQLKLHINFAVIRDKLAALIEGKKEVSITFPDAPFRRKLKEKYFVNSDQYHSPDIVKKGVIYEPTPFSGKTLEVKVAAAEGATFTDEPINKGRALLLSLELDHATIKPNYSAIQLKNLGKDQGDIDYDHGARVSLIERVLRAAKIPDTDFKRVKTILENHQNLPFEQNVELVANELKQLGFDLDTSFKKNGMDAFYPSLLRSPDAFEKGHSDRSVAATLSLLEKGLNQDLVVQTLTAHPELFANNNRLKNTLINAADFENTLLYYPAWQIAETLAKGGFKVEHMPEVVEKLRARLSGERAGILPAAGMLIKLGSNVDEAVAGLSELAGGNRKSLNPEVTLLMKESLKASPVGAMDGIARALADKRVELQRGAIRLLEEVKVASPTVVALLQEVLQSSKRLKTEDKMKITKILPLLNQSSCRWLIENRVQ